MKKNVTETMILDRIEQLWGELFADARKRGESEDDVLNEVTGVDVRRWAMSDLGVRA